MTTALSPIALPEGYALLDRLGSGGYGEVWRATAPGGMEKAVKIVFGHCDGDLAERELKSLDRVRSVRHPFLLTIERYEVVDNRLVIVTELADKSLDKLFQECRGQDKPGIPREQLITLLTDAAEALDCLSERHGLQHLDIKPENLLIVGDHIKVADFGLVKDLAARTINTMVGGMTPLYSSPEVYDDNPSDRSDQYSLAIVYQQMLTGTVPFSGRTPAQLAKQHTMAEPNLGSLGAKDQAVVGRALAKDPCKRYASNREFVRALSDAPGDAGHGLAASQPIDGVQPSYTPQAASDTRAAVAISTTPLPQQGGATNLLPHDGADAPLSAAPGRPQLDFPPADHKVSDAALPPIAAPLASMAQPTLFVAIGGVGAQMLAAVRERWAGQGEAAPPAEWLAFDTDREELMPLTRGESPQIAPEDVLLTPLRRPKDYRHASRDLLPWVSRRWLYHIPRSLQTRGYRPLGRIAAVDNADAVVRALHARLSRLAADGAHAGRPVQVVVLSGMCGGTGGGAALDIAQAARNLAGGLSRGVSVRGVFALTPTANDSLAASNLVSLLTELTHAQASGNVGQACAPGAARHFEAATPPLDEAYVQPVSARGNALERRAALAAIADYLLLRSTIDLSPVLAAAGGNAAGMLRTFNVARPAQIEQAAAVHRQARLQQALLRYWVEEADSMGAAGDPELLACFGRHSRSRFARQFTSRFNPMLAAEDPNSDPQSGATRREYKRAVQHAAERFAQWAELLQPADGEGSAADPALAATARSISAGVIDRLYASRPAGDGALFDFPSLASCHDVPSEAASVAPGTLAAAETGVLGCGHTRYSLLLTPAAERHAPLASELLKLRGTATVAQAEVDAAVLICEGAALAPAQMAACVAQALPDVMEAASRLHARTDITWTDLRTPG
ncbi:Tubulin-like protein [Pirellulimonas nuda]|uniref:Tubulin-like protein n=1 Tax=Pirellulimonas nuda TaxID=2528009 RepID=A0A518D996_9BACT|nr:tubulin-like doman-containing protein [Pirellulimonas nuda]QDU88046.1 Tubulin-like protein [Pirellulimonas nuda]